MLKRQWILTPPLVFATMFGSAHASAVRDNAGMFDPAAVRQAEETLNQVERDSRVATTIETIESLQGESLDEATLRHARQSGAQGIFVLIPKQEHKIEVLVSRAFRETLLGRRVAIRNAFVDGFKRGDYDAGLRQGIRAIEDQVAAAKAENGGVLRAPVPRAGAPIPGRPLPRPAKPAFGLASLLGIGLLIIVILVGIRFLGRLFSGGYRGGYAGPSRMGGPGYGGPGPSYGGPGYGGGGGFLSSLFGGIGGAMAGNWLYDQFSGRHHQGGDYADNTSSGAAPDVSSGADTGPDWAGMDGGADWGGGDAGGGGDWGGGGGGDWGGGGGGDDGGGSW